MRQFYFLSIVTNLLAGFVLVADKIESSSFVDSVRPTIERPDFRVVLAFLTFFVGFFKLLSVTYGDIQIVGDLVPAFSGLTLGWILLFEFYRTHNEIPSTGLDRLDDIFLKNRFPFGVLGISSGILHFLFPAALLL